MAVYFREHRLPPLQVLLVLSVFGCTASAEEAAGSVQRTLQRGDLCHPLLLSQVQCPEEEHGVSWVHFLDLTCRYCKPGLECQAQPTSDEMVYQAKAIAEQAYDTGFRCAVGLLAAMIVSAQFFLVKAPVGQDMDELFSKSASLWPFPFNTLQYSLYTNMIPARLNMCDTQSARSMTNTFVPRVHAEDGEKCGMVYTDDMLVRRCRSRKMEWQPLAAQDDALERIRCPDYAGMSSMEPELAFKLRKYGDRAAEPSKQCQSSRGMWREAMSDVHKCVLITVGHHLGFRPGQRMLDWGSGCGHKLTWAKQLFDIDGVGLDVEGGAVAWAQRHSAGTFCHADGRDLSWLPDLTFDYVFSYAALYHLPKLDQCRTGKQLISKLRVGGKAYFGWNQDPSMSHWEWRACLTEPERVADLTADDIATIRSLDCHVEAVEDGFLFPPTTTSAHKHYLYQYPAYSVFVTRRA
eukprot:TRINITY_DN47416_c0_g1_i1.p1 TRINITY_DN47416_c0_g1~~TRINITY_DN47416_c0_g1_i1.p1  ORF type:complete len:463 (-),score=56.26 TRINITY_DN47416_c0_g1_i1:49-1437(-)